MILEQADFVSTVRNGPMKVPGSSVHETSFSLDNTDGIVLFYDEDGKEGSPKYIKEKAIKKRYEIGYEVITISAFDIQDIVEEEQQKDWEW